MEGRELEQMDVLRGCVGRERRVMDMEGNMNSSGRDAG